MSRRKRILLTVGLLVVAAVAVGSALSIALPRPRINLGSYQRINAGMDRSAVEDIIGCPPGDYSAAPGRTVAGAGERQTEMYMDLILRDIAADDPWRPEVAWWSDAGGLLIWFNSRGQVVGKQLYPTRPTGTLIDRVRRWLGL
jgi:hypothetical protein